MCIKGKVKPEKNVQYTVQYTAQKKVIHSIPEFIHFLQLLYSVQLQNEGCKFKIMFIMYKEKVTESPHRSLYPRNFRHFSRHKFLGQKQTSCSITPTHDGVLFPSQDDGVQRPPGLDHPKTRGKGEGRLGEGGGGGQRRRKSAF